MLPHCLFCHHRNPPGAKFCNECGSPLHLSPCETCGAINNLTDTHCWQCNAALRPPKAPLQGEGSERDPKISAPEAADRAQPFTASEQDYRGLAQELAAAAPVIDQAAAADPARPRPGERASLDLNIPEPKSLFVQADDTSRSRWRGLMATLLAAAVGSAIAVGAYLYLQYLRDGTSPESIVSTAAPSGMPADASTEPRVAPDLAAVPPAVPAGTPSPTTRLEPEDRDAPADPPVTSDAEKAPAAAPTCPPPVEAMALCERFVRPSQQ
jgi:ribosomal protein L40E